MREAFAGLQATLGEACTPGDCAYFPGRVHDELHRMDRAVKATELIANRDKTNTWMRGHPGDYR
ncbi:hypothetical protein [Streptomyces cirratus]|uniref:hypothetical protein n=1 Tax=Streptomyces cirratus TaxID=68187 RepID=UPI00167C9B47|nr:hypothetical protein [Streptomyces cirratus]